MELQDQLLAIERRLWTNDAAFYEAHGRDSLRAGHFRPTGRLEARPRR
jgi:hypothetical protein